MPWFWSMLIIIISVYQSSNRNVKESTIKTHQYVYVFTISIHISVWGVYSETN